MCGGIFFHRLTVTASSSKVSFARLTIHRLTEDLCVVLAPCACSVPTVCETPSQLTGSSAGQHGALQHYSMWGTRRAFTESCTCVCPSWNVIMSLNCLLLQDSCAVMEKKCVLECFKVSLINILVLTLYQIILAHFITKCYWFFSHPQVTLWIEGPELSVLRRMHLYLVCISYWSSSAT